MTDHRGSMTAENALAAAIHEAYETDPAGTRVAAILAALHDAGWTLVRRDALDAALALHQPDPDGGMGWRSDGRYGVIDPACRTCGTSDEYAVPWPCATVRALRGEE